MLYHFDKDRHSPDIAHRTGFGLATSSIVMAVGLSIVYAKMAALASGKQFLATRGKLFISLICGCASVSPGFAIKVNLELVRQ